METRHPLLSIVITCYNYEKYVVECIESALSQNFPSLEVVVVDDGSTDNSWAEIQKYGDRVVSLKTENRGALATSLTGFSLSKGSFVYFLDADDALAEGALAQLAPYLTSDVSKIQFRLLPVDKDGAVVGTPFPNLSAQNNSDTLIESIRIRGTYDTPPTSGNIYRRDVYENLGEMGYERAIDGVPYLLAPFVGRVVSIEQPLGRYRRHNTNLSAFSSLSSTRVQGYIQRFMSRLHHLSDLVRERSAGEQAIKIRDDYAYLTEMQLMIAVLEGRRPDLGTVGKYMRAAWRENTGVKKLVLAFFGIALFVLPNSLAKELTSVRLNPSRSSRLRSRLKRAFT
jgi:cellulose synthase/poly-beta-1,6-N-acetylglucosamine synthase-like glycosyltransferase